MERMRKRAKIPSNTAETLILAIARISVRKYLFLIIFMKKPINSKIVDKIMVKMLKDCV
jgi:hypothetical protein